jgi:hypothetical protein
MEVEQWPLIINLENTIDKDGLYTCVTRQFPDECSEVHEAISRLAHGKCFHFAVLLMDLLQLDTSVAFNEKGDKPLSPRRHWCVELKDGRWLDAYGIMTFEELKQRYQCLNLVYNRCTRLEMWRAWDVKPNELEAVRLLAKNFRYAKAPQFEVLKKCANWLNSVG